MDVLITIAVFAVVWFGCSIINLIWYKHYPNVMATEFHSTLILLAPLATFFVVFGMIGVWAYNLPLRAMCMNTREF